MAFWPLPLFLIALALVLSGFTDSETSMYACIVGLNVGIVYAAVWAVAATVRAATRREWTTQRVTLVVSMVAVLYHLVAIALPRPDSGYVRVGYGDLMLTPGVLISVSLDGAHQKSRGDSLADPAQLEKALERGGDVTFTVAAAERVDDGWVLLGRLGEVDGPGVDHLVRLSEPFAMTSVVVDTFSDRRELANGTLHILGETELVVARPGRDERATALAPEVVEWRRTAVEEVSRLVDGRWLVLHDGRVGTIESDGSLGSKVSIPAGTPVDVTSSIGVTYALTDQSPALPRYRIHVISNGARDEVISALLTDALAKHDLGPPVRIVAAESTIWVLGYSTVMKKTVAVALPDKQSHIIEPGSVTAVISGGQALIVGTLRGVLRVTSEGVESVGEGWIPAEMLSVHDGVPGAAVRDKDQQKLTLTAFEKSGPKVFLPSLHLRVH